MTADTTPERPSIAATILSLSLLFGVAGDFLLNVPAWGIGATLWFSALSIAALWCCARFRRDVLRSALFPLVVAAIVSTGFVLRASHTLQTIDLWTIGVAFIVGALPSHAAKLWSTTIIRYVLSALFVMIETAAGPFQLLFGEMEWSRSARARSLGPAVRGALLSLPLLILFGALLTSADAAFAALIERAFDFDLDEVFEHAFVTLLIAFLVAGFVRSLVSGAPLPRPGGDSSLPLVGATECAIVVTLLNVLFATFVLVQIRYLFGGASLIRIAPSLTRAEYARNGFFQLVWVVALLLPTLLLIDWLMDKTNERAYACFRAATALQLALIAVIVASALFRMNVYAAEFGLTEGRLYSSAFIIWLALLLSTFGMTVLRGRRERFTAASMIAAVAVLFALHAINPDALIAKTNIARAEEGRRSLDVRYLLSLSDDALPFLHQRLDLVPSEDRPMTIEALRRRAAFRDELSWRSRNLAR